MWLNQAGWTENLLLESRLLKQAGLKMQAFKLFIINIIFYSRVDFEIMQYLSNVNVNKTRGLQLGQMKNILINISNKLFSQLTKPVNEISQW